MTDKKGGSWQNQLPITRAAIIVLIAVGLAGVAMICNGLYMKAKAELSQVLLKRSFTARLAGNDNAKPWPWADFRVAAEISVPRLHQTAVVLEGASGQTLAFGPALVSGTPEPGQPGTAVIAAHRDTHFQWLKDVMPGDLITVTTPNGEERVFRAQDSRIADWDNSGIDVTALGNHLALATCWPFDAKAQGPLRYILNAELVEDTNPVSVAVMN